MDELNTLSRKTLVEMYHNYSAERTIFIAERVEVVDLLRRIKTVFENEIIVPDGKCWNIYKEICETMDRQEGIINEQV